MTEIVGIVPAAGHATRLQPLVSSKEVLSIHGRPVMDYLVDRMRAGGCTRFRVVTRRQKTDVIAHSKELGAEVVLADPATVSESVWAGISDLGPETVVLLGFPDTIWEPEDGYRVLVDAVDEGNDVALGLFRIDPTDLPRSDVVVTDERGMVSGVHVKPATPASDRIWGCAAARVEALHALPTSRSPGEHFDRLCNEGRKVRGIPLSDRWIDVGTTVALERARMEQGAHSGRSGP